MTAYAPGDTWRLVYPAVEQKAPAASGIYVIYTAQRWVYVGEDDDIRRSLFRHLNAPTPCMTGSGPLSFSFELAGPDERRLRQQALMAELEPACQLPAA